jgi:hypothetical protein
VTIFEPFIFQSLRIDELPRVVDLLVQAFDLHGLNGASAYGLVDCMVIRYVIAGISNILGDLAHPLRWQQDPKCSRAAFERHVSDISCSTIRKVGGRARISLESIWPC